MKKVFAFCFLFLANLCIGYTQQGCWKMICPGDNHILGIKKDGTLWAWGSNSNGQLGDGTLVDKKLPTQIGTDNDWKAVSAGASHSLAIKNNGTLWAWGFNTTGQLGDGTTVAKTTPVQIGSDNDWAQITNSGHSMALKTNGTLWGWGYNGYGAIGDGTTTHKNVPTQVGTDNNWIQIFAGAYHTLALKSDSTLWTWGYNNFGQLGDGTTANRSTPLQIGTSTNWKSISARSSHSIAIKSDGTIWSWGSNSNGQIGDGTTTNRNTPTQSGTDNDWLSVSAGYFHTIALKKNKTLWAWGSNSDGQLGDGTKTNRFSQVKIGTDTTWFIAQAGGNFSQGIKKNGEVWAWGINTNGQVGDGTTFAKTSPVFIDCINACSQTIVKDTANLTNCSSINYKNITYSTSVTINDTIRTQQNCDSIYRLVNINIQPSNPIDGRITHLTKGGISKVILTVSGTNSYVKEVSKNYFEGCNNTGNNITIKPSKNNDVTKANGVTSVDVLLTQRHILNTTKLNSAYKIIAADVDGNKTVNSVDVLRMKRLILGTDTTFTKGSGVNKVDRLWEFVDSAYVFPDTTNPFPFKDSISFNNLTSNKTNQTFIGVKLGDVNYDWNPAVARGVVASSLQLVVSGEQTTTGNLLLSIASTNFNNIAALQTTLHFDNTKYEFVAIESNKLQVDYNSSKANETGNIALLWTDKSAEAKSYNDEDVLFSLILKPRSLGIGNLELVVSNNMVETEAWDNNFIKRNIALSSKEINNLSVANNQLLIYPNPTKGNVTIQNAGADEILIIDYLGKIISKQSINNKASTININLKSGVYIVQAKMHDGSMRNEKLVVQ